MPSFTALPTEIVLAIAELLGPADIKGLSCMDRRLRNAVTHILFRTLSIALPLVSHLFLEHMLKKYERFISKIHLHVLLRPNLEEDGKTMSSIGGTTKSDLLRQLVNGKIFSHIDSFSIHFDPCQFDIGAGHWYGNDGGWGGGYGSGSITVFEDEEQELACHEYEKEHVWRAQYMQVFAEITANPNIRKLRIENILPRRTSVFDTLEWEEFLGQITHLDLSIFGAECAGWSVNTMPGFLQFMDKVLPNDIMKYLINLKHLRLEASKLSVVGPGVDGGRTFCPHGQIRSRLESLEVKNMVIGFGLGSFLGRQRDNLRELTLHNCMCLAITEPQSTDESDDEYYEIRWSEIWEYIVESCPAMRKVTYLQDERPLLPVTVEEDIPEGRDGLTVWRHVLIDEDWGTVQENEEANHAELCLNHSCAAYDEMMKVLAERREKDESSSDAETTETK